MNGQSTIEPLTTSQRISIIVLSIIAVIAIYWRYFDSKLPKEPFEVKDMVSKTMKVTGDPSWGPWVHRITPLDKVEYDPETVDWGIVPTPRSNQDTKTMEEAAKIADPYHDYVRGIALGERAGNPSRAEFVGIRPIHKLYDHEGNYVSSHEFIFALVSTMAYLESGDDCSAIGPPPIVQRIITGDFKSRYYGTLAMGCFQFMPANWTAWSNQLYGFVLLPDLENQNMLAVELVDNMSRYLSIVQGFNTTDITRCIAQVWYSGKCSLEWVPLEQSCDVHRYEVDYLNYIEAEYGMRMEPLKTLKTSVKTCGTVGKVKDGASKALEVGKQIINILK